MEKTQSKETKICTRCGGDPKPLSDFYGSNHKKNGVQSRCIKCTRSKALESYEGINFVKLEHSENLLKLYKRFNCNLTKKDLDKLQLQYIF